jgi:hypothetical protein
MRLDTRAAQNFIGRFVVLPDASALPCRLTRSAHRCVKLRRRVGAPQKDGTYLLDTSDARLTQAVAARREGHGTGSSGGATERLGDLGSPDDPDTVFMS